MLAPGKRPRGGWVMAAIQFFFGFEGRLGRGRFWVVGLCFYAAAALALALEPEARTTLTRLIWLPASAALFIYLFAGMWGFALAVLTMAVDLFVITGSGGRIVVAPFIVSLAVALVLGWMIVAVAAKRLHDRDKSGWWLLVFVVAPLVLIQLGVPFPSSSARKLLLLAAFALHVWSFVEMGCRPGTRGPNRYGADPAARDAAPAASVRIAG
jgi:uncharacterized membrane protein YhaH (DUF805 family)